MSLKLLDNDFGSGTIPNNSAGRLASSPARACSVVGSMTYTIGSNTPAPAYLVNNTLLAVQLPDANGQQITFTMTQALAGCLNSGVGLAFRVMLSVPRLAPNLVFSLDGTNLASLGYYPSAGNQITPYAYQPYYTWSNSRQTNRFAVPAQDIAGTANDNGSQPATQEIEVTFLIRANLGGGNYLVECWVRLLGICPYPICLAQMPVAVSAGQFQIIVNDTSH